MPTSHPPASAPRLHHGFSFAELRAQSGLERLDQLYLERLRTHDTALHDRLLAYRQNAGGLAPTDTSELLLACAPLLDEIVAEVFGIQPELEARRQQTLAHDPVFHFKKEFVLKRARRRLAKKEAFENFAELDAWLAQALAQAGLNDPDRELAVARLGLKLLADEKTQADDARDGGGTTSGKKEVERRLEQPPRAMLGAIAEGIEKLTRWCIRALTTPEGRLATHGWAGLRLPQPREHHKLVPTVPLPSDSLGRVQGRPSICAGATALDSPTRA